MKRSISTVIGCSAMAFAVCAGILEMVLAVSTMIIAGDLPPGLPMQVGIRVGVFGLAGVLILLVWSGRRFARWLLLILLGVIGLGSMVVPMVTSLISGSGLIAALGGDAAPGFAVIRAVHIVLVVVGVVALLQPQPAAERKSTRPTPSVSLRS